MHDVLIGIDAGTSVIKAVAFDLGGEQIAVASVPNRYVTRPDGAATQPLNQTWDDCASTLHALAGLVPDLAARTAAIGVTAQGDGTWLIDKAGDPVGDGWLWLDARAADVVRDLRAAPTDAARFQTTGTGLNACQMGAQLAHMQRHTPEVLALATTAFHPKDWLYFRLTGTRATDPSEAIFTFGDFRTRRYDDGVIDALGLTAHRHLLPPIIDGTQTTEPLSPAAAAQTGLRAGTPVSLGYVDVICTALGAGIHTGAAAGCSIVGSTGMHMRTHAIADVVLNQMATGYVMCFPVPGIVAQMQSNMAATLNIDWILSVANDLLTDLGHSAAPGDLIARVDGWLAHTASAKLIYHPYISDAGERGPFVNNAARASLIGLQSGHRFPDLVRAVVEGLAYAARDCYGAMGGVPAEVRLSGGAARSRKLRDVMAAVLGKPVRTSARQEAGAAGAAMIAAVANGHYASMDACIAAWVTPLLSAVETPSPALVERYHKGFDAYRDARAALAPIWVQLPREGT
jgi:erythritol kinase (D-erythritol 1-phosphate-forming)